MYELMILGQLARLPMHGYMIAKTIGYVMGPARPVQWGALYPVLNRLEAEGLIRAEETPECPDGRNRKVYAITPAGQERLHTLLLDTEHHQSDYTFVFSYKVSHFAQLTPAERIRICRHYAVYCERQLDHLEQKVAELSGPEHPLPAEQRENILLVMNHAIQRWQKERSWAESLLQREHARGGVLDVSA